MFNFLNEYPLWLESIIIGSILMVVVIFFGILIPLIKPTIKKKSMVYLYSFSTGYFIVLALFGLLQESFIDLKHETVGMSKYLSSFIVIIVLISGVTIGMGGGLVFRFLITRKNPELHLNHSSHSHADSIFNISDIDNPKSKWVGILLLLSHRIVAGLTLGLLVYNFKYHQAYNAFNLGLIIAFVLHLIPEILIIYYRQREANVGKWIAIINGILFKFLLIILIIIGAYLGEALNSQFWIIPLLLAISAGAMSFAALFEFIPEILHVRNDSGSVWYKISITLISSFLIAIALLTLGA